MSDQTPKEEGPKIQHGGFTFATCQLTLEVGNLPLLVDGRNDNFVLVDKEESGSLQPVGFVHFHIDPSFVGPVSLSGMIPNNPPGHGLFLLMKNDSTKDLILLEQDVNSYEFARFDFGGAGPQTLSAGKTTPIVYEPDVKRWVSSG
jgi:hypothetical protein